MLRLGDFSATISRAVTTTADSFEATRPYLDFVVCADRNVHLRRTDDADTKATEADFLLLAEHYAEVTVANGGWLSFVLASGEPDGTIRITPVT